MNICKFATKYIFFSVIGISIITTSANAAPTKKETYDFIASKVNYVVEDDQSIANYTLTSSENMCLLTYSMEFSNYSDKSNPLKSTSSYIIDLKTINPNKIDVRYTDVVTRYKYFVRVDTIESKPLILMDQRYSGNRSTPGIAWNDEISKEFSALIFTKDKDAAQRVSKALRHLVTICGGKDELF